MLSGIHFFNPPNTDEADDTYLSQVLISQFGFFGPAPQKYKEIATPMMAEIDALGQAVVTSGGVHRYQSTLAHYLSAADIQFLLSFMKIDLRDRPSAKDLLESQWFIET